MTDGRHVKSFERREVIRSEIVIRDRLIDMEKAAEASREMCKA
jgi:hypothetical protein